ncbi:MAG: 5'/3'-nucleotidase SurE [Chloroflexi bacterium]|nr:5'/3'-nucleotidase SurE [Chloroflexota bacterium]
MRILLSNDDGIYSPGLWAAAEALKDVGKVVVVAPDRDQSGVGAATTLIQPIPVEKALSQIEGVEAYSVRGTPGDCVVLAIEALELGSFDLVISGINHGENMGEAVLLSGTMGAALHGYLRGTSSVAISVTSAAATSVMSVHLEVAALMARFLARAVAEESLPRPMLLNVSVPGVSLDLLEGVEVTRLGQNVYRPTIQQFQDERRQYYMVRYGRSGLSEPGTDVTAVRNNRISITPLHTDMTTDQQIPFFRSAALEASQWFNRHKGSL